MRAIIFAILALCSSHALAQISIDGVNLTPETNNQVGGGLILSDIDYEVDGDEIGAERTILHGDFSSGLGTVNALGFVGLIVGGELDLQGNEVGDGRGFLLGGGVRGRAHQDEGVSINWYATLTYIHESYEKNAEKFNITNLELQGAGICEYFVNSGLSLYAGAHLFPWNDGELERDIYSRKTADDIERDTILGLSLGLNFRVNRAFLRPELRLVGQQSISFNAGTTL